MFLFKMDFSILSYNYKTSITVQGSYFHVELSESLKATLFDSQLIPFLYMRHNSFETLMQIFENFLWKFKLETTDFRGSPV